MDGQYQYQYGDIGDVPTLIMMQYKECGRVEGRYDHEGRVKANLFHCILLSCQRADTLCDA